MRLAYPILFALLLGLPFVLRHFQTDGTDAERPQGDALKLVVVTPHNGDIRGEFATAFDRWYRQHYRASVVIDYHVPGGTSDMIRLLANKPTGLDVAWGGGDYTFYHDLQPKGILQPMHLDPPLMRAAFPHDALAGVRLYDPTKDSAGNPTPQWVGACLSSFGITYNPQLYQALELSPPQTWADLTNPKLFRLIALADPAHSGSASVAYMMVIQRAMADAEEELFSRRPELKKLPRPELARRAEYRDAISAGWKRGMGELVLIAANARYFTDSSEIVPTDVGRGEAAAGMSIDFYARVTEETVGADRSQFVLPRAATAITPDAVAILSGTSGRQLELATRFVEFLLSREGQLLWILRPGEPGGPIRRSPRRMPVRADVYANQTGWADHGNPFIESGGFNQRGQWMGLMSDTSPIWIAAWIDSRDALTDACVAILSVKDPTRCAALFAVLADVPVTMQDVERRQAERTALEQSHGDANLWNARQRILWSDRFRKHYFEVAAEARQ
ncbi:MAG TPA: extracellular solute-binding protein [Tepidisphaeraceae bacterium]|nr:extracellular solute-binding protein [Tepidisphaeraceae bacterium]